MIPRADRPLFARGIMLGLERPFAMLGSGASLLAAHLGFVISTEPALLPALIAAKLSGALTAAALALWAGRGAAETARIA